MSDVMDEEELVVWEPLGDNFFDRFENEMHYESISYEIDFILVFTDTKTDKKVTFTYRAPENTPLPVLTFRFTEEMGRADIEYLITQSYEKKKKNNSVMTYNPTFYKIRNSAFLKWYDTAFPARPIIYPEVEHHLYITSNFFIDVLSEVLPEITIEE